LLASRIAAAMPPLSEDEQRLAIELYRQLAEGEPVVPQRLAPQIGVSAGWVDQTLECWPGVYRDELGGVIGFWGLTQRPMPPHGFLVDGRKLWTWCSWDSLFIPVLLGRNARVESVCATTGEPVSAEVTPTGVSAVSPAGAVISFLRPDAEFSHDVIVSFCHHVLFFRSEDAGKAWTATRPNAFLLTLEQGFELGRLVVEAKYGQIDSLGEVA